MILVKYTKIYMYTYDFNFFLNLQFCTLLLDSFRYMTSSISYTFLTMYGLKERK